MPTGRVKWYDATKGFGFVTSDEGGDVFLPKGALPAGVPGIGVATGPCSPDDLDAAGAAYVLKDLTALPALLREIAVGSGPAA